MAVFSEESVVTGHPFDAETTGLVAIRALNVDDILASAKENAYTISNVEVTGNTVTWDQAWISSDGSQFCRQGQSAVVEDGTIVSWTWSSNSTCP